MKEVIEHFLENNPWAEYYWTVAPRPNESLASQIWNEVSGESKEDKTFTDSGNHRASLSNGLLDQTLLLVWIVLWENNIIFNQERSWFCFSGRQTW